MSKEYPRLTSWPRIACVPSVSIRACTSIVRIFRAAGKNSIVLAWAMTVESNCASGRKEKESMDGKNFSRLVVIVGRRGRTLDWVCGPSAHNLALPQIFSPGAEQRPTPTRYRYDCWYCSTSPHTKQANKQTSSNHQPRGARQATTQDNGTAFELDSNPGNMESTAFCSM